MDQNVLVTIRGTENECNGNPSTEIETIQPGIYNFMQNKHIITYEEPCDGSAQSSPLFVKNLLKITPGSVSLVKRGHTSSDMFFKKGHHHSGIYKTAGGSLSLPIDIITSELVIKENTDCIDIYINYSLGFGNSYTSMHKIYINIHSV